MTSVVVGLIHQHHQNRVVVGWKGLGKWPYKAWFPGAEDLLGPTRALGTSSLFACIPPGSVADGAKPGRCMGIGVGEGAGKRGDP